MTPPPIELSAEQLDELIERVKSRNLLDEDYATIAAMGETIHVLSHLRVQSFHYAIEMAGNV